MIRCAAQARVCRRNRWRDTEVFQVQAEASLTREGLRKDLKVVETIVDAGNETTIVRCPAATTWDVGASDKVIRSRHAPIDAGFICVATSECVKAHLILLACDYCEMQIKNKDSVLCDKHTQHITVGPRVRHRCIGLFFNVGLSEARWSRGCRR